MDTDGCIGIYPYRVERVLRFPRVRPSRPLNLPFWVPTEKYGLLAYTGSRICQASGNEWVSCSCSCLSSVGLLLGLHGIDGLGFIVEACRLLDLRNYCAGMVS